MSNRSCYDKCPWIVLSLMHAVLLTAELGAAQDGPSPSAVLVKVNGEPITEADLEFLTISRRVAPEARASARERLIEHLIDRRLIRSFLAGRNAKPDEFLLTSQIEQILKSIRKGGDDPEQVLARLGYTTETLREELSLPLAWQAHVAQVVTNKQIQSYFQEHRQELDGTQVRASQIFLKVAADADEAARQQALDNLKSLREQVQAGKLSFADAAHSESQAPSRDQGGDLGYFTYRGTMPEPIAKAAFSLKPGEISEPLTTRFGADLVTVTDRKPGDLSLEDVRPVVLGQLSQDLWDETVRDLRSRATIERSEEGDKGEKGERGERGLRGG